MLDTLSHRLKNKSNTATHIGAAQSPYPHWGTNLWFHLGCRTLELQYVTVWDNMALTGQDDVGRKIFRHQDYLKLWDYEMQWVAILIGFHKHKSKEPEASKSLKKTKNFSFAIWLSVKRNMTPSSFSPALLYIYCRSVLRSPRPYELVITII